ncbi:hypothetical protein J7394_19985 [Ruegeria sp. R13_0]|uniref:hypothetical protein n=1 Tax=Ruegeria sp. R13_0 TaxID=2821099 RepID=UPI001ADA48D9|nr:hypothetical protein [Ruegeria sp. R13_0]MBO9436504.1 hypothetical protein [Ruegeria sp. R13_0]
MFKMMRALMDPATLTVVSTTIFAAVMSSAANAGDGLDREFDLINDSRFTSVTELYISNINDPIWGRNLMGEYPLHAGYYGEFEPDFPNGYCRFDLLVVFDTGYVDKLWDINLCEVPVIHVDGYGFSIVYA